MSAAIRGLGRQLLLRVRMNRKEQLAFEAASALSGLSISSWSRMVLRKAAIADHHNAGRKADL